MIRSLLLMFVCLLTGFAGLAGCTNEPALNNRVTPDLRNADYPDLVPLEDLFALQPPPQQARATVEQNLKARSASLEHRAEALRRATD